MANFKQTVITKAAHNLIAKSLFGSANINFTRVATSKYDYKSFSQSKLESLTSLEDIKQYVAVDKVEKIGEASVNVSVKITNANITEGYYVNTIGLFAIDPEEGEILYSITVAETADYFPADNGVNCSGINLDLVTEVSNASNVNITVNYAGYATNEDIEKVNSQLNETAQNLEDINLSKLDKNKWTREQIDNSKDSNLININDFDEVTRATLLNFKTKNLFNKNTATLGYYVASGSGNLVVNENFYASEFIEIEPDTSYTINKIAQQGAFYNSDKNYIKGFDGNGKTQTVLTPENAKYIRISVHKDYLNVTQFEKGTSATDYVPYGAVVNPYIGEEAIKRENIANNAINSSKVDKGSIAIKDVCGKNLFDKNNITKAHYVASGSGTLTESTDFNASDFIEVEENKIYTLSNNAQQGAFYNSDKNYISGFSGGTSPYKITVPSSAKYIRLSVHNTYLNTTQFEKGEFTTKYENYKKLVSYDNIEHQNEFQRIKKIMSKLLTASEDNQITVKLVGDSITHGVGGTGFSQDGELILSLYSGSMTWHVNTSGKCWANSLKDYLENKFTGVTVKNYGMTGCVTSFIEQGLDTNQIIDSNDDIIILMIGTNNRNKNVGYTKDVFRQKLDHLVKRIQSMGKEVILMSNIPSSVADETTDKNFHMEDVDNATMWVAENNNMEYISVYKSMVEYCKYNNITIDSLLGSDGLHPNDNGYNVMFYLIANALGFGVKRDGATW